jgi:Acyl-protein synthetase, LuxE
MLQLLNVLAHGAPYHSVLTEDLGRLAEGQCPCGRPGRRFQLLGRVPKAELRGCANV